SASAVPTYAWSAYSVTSVENCAESATTVKPQTSATTTAAQTGRRPMASAHVPEQAISAAVVSARPKRSLNIPPATHPSAQMPMTAKVASAAAVREANSVSAAKTRNHAQTA